MKINLIDKRCKKPFTYNLSWTGTLRTGEIINNVQTPDQVKIVDAFCNSETKSGFIIAPPRTGKSVIGVAITCKLRVKTLIVANQLDLLWNFYKSFERDTNLKELQDSTKAPIVKVIQSQKDLDEFYKTPEKYDVILTTYQRFIRETDTATRQDKIQPILNKFGLVIIDEVHSAGAIEFLRFLYSLDCCYRLGLTATPLRKDGTNKLTSKLIGEIIYQAKNLSLIPELHVVKTGVKVRVPSATQRGGFTIYENNLSDSPKRKALIVNEVFKDLQEHQCIIIPMKRVIAQEELADEINKRAKKEGLILQDERIAKVFEGALSSASRKEILKEVDEGKVRVLVSSLQIMQQGIDMKAPTCIYICYPMTATGLANTPQDAYSKYRIYNNDGTVNKSLVGAPKFFQLTNRICTPAPNKRQPIVKIFVDDTTIAYNCFKSLWSFEIKPALRHNNHRSTEPLYKITEDFFKEIGWTGGNYSK